jgi:KDO2-lipid IV(A) lauroyltransferase
VSDVPWAKRTRRTLRVWAIRAGLRLASALPFRLAWWIGGLLGQVAWWVARGSRGLVLEHLALALPELSEAERRDIARRSFLHLGHGAAELAQMARIDRDLEAYVGWDPGSEDLLREAHAGGKGLILVTGHLGSWELTVRRIVRSGIPTAVVAARSWDPRIDELTERLRARGGVSTLFREDPGGGRALLKALRAGQGLGILIDQDTRVQSVFVPFFGHLAATPRAAADLALRFGCPVLVGGGRRRGPNPGDGHVLTAEKIEYDPNPADREAEVLRITEACTARIERAIRRAPAEWVWMHRRWKSRPLK